MNRGNRVADTTSQTQQTQSGGGSQSDTGGATQQNGGSQATATTTPERPDWLPEKFFDAKDGIKGKDLRAEFDRLTAIEAEQQTRRLTLPDAPEKYQLLLPEGFEIKDTDGKPVQFKFDEADPRLPEIRKLAHEAGLDQPTFSRLLSIHAQYEHGEQGRIDDARKAEIDKLGANGPARVDAVGTWLKARIGEKPGDAILNRLVLASDIEAVEDLMKKFSGQNVVTFNQQHREEKSEPPKSRAERLFPNMRAS